MLLPAHKKLAIFISEKFSLSEELKDWLVEGALLPDKESPIWGWKPHHFGRERDIEKFIYKARRNFLKGKIEKSYYFLGFALHFVGDASIYSPGIYQRYTHGRGAGLKTWYARRKAQKLHRTFEKEINQLDFEENVPLFIIDTPLKITSAIKNFLYKDEFYSPQATLNRIYQASFALTEITLRNPQKLSLKERELIERIPKLKRKWAVMSGFDFISFIVIGFLNLWVFLNLGFLFSMIPLLIIYFLIIYLIDKFQNLSNPWKLEGWYKKKISIFGLSKE